MKNISLHTIKSTDFRNRLSYFLSLVGSKQSIPDEMQAEIHLNIIWTKNRDFYAIPYISNSYKKKTVLSTELRNNMKHYFDDAYANKSILKVTRASGSILLLPGLLYHALIRKEESVIWKAIYIETVNFTSGTDVNRLFKNMFVYKFEMPEELNAKE